MTVPEVYRILRRVTALRSRMDHYMSRIEELESLKTSIGTILPKADIVQRSPEDGSRLEGILIDIEEMQEKLRRAVAEWKDGIQDAEDLINMIDSDTRKTVLELRFIHGMKWEDIAEKTGYTPEWVQRIKKRAIAEIARKC